MKIVATVIVMAAWMWLGSAIYWFWLEVRYVPPFTRMPLHQRLWRAATYGPLKLVGMFRP